MTTALQACEYSLPERKLIRAFGMEALADSPSVIPGIIYNACAIKVVQDDIRGAHQRALQRVLQALAVGSPLRLTPEFDELADFDDRTFQVGDTVQLLRRISIPRLGAEPIPVGTRFTVTDVSVQLSPKQYDCRSVLYGYKLRVHAADLQLSGARIVPVTPKD